MNIPNSFMLKGKRWKILRPKVIKQDGVLCDGLCSWHTRTIRISADLNKREAVHTFLHELFHAVVYEAHIGPGSNFNDELEDVLAEAFVDVLKSLFTIKLKRNR